MTAVTKHENSLIGAKPAQNQSSPIKVGLKHVTDDFFLA